MIRKFSISTVLLLLILSTSVLASSDKINVNGNISTVQRDAYVDISGTGTSSSSLSASNIDHIGILVALYLNDSVVDLVQGNRVEYTKNAVSKTITYKAYFSGLYELTLLGYLETKEGDYYEIRSSVNKYVTNNCKICVNKFGEMN